MDGKQAATSAGVPIFSLGKVVATPGAIDALREAGEDARTYLRRHVCGDWGEVCAEDAAENDLSIGHGFRLLSAYTLKTGERMWIITEADRSYTTLLLPDEY